MIDLPDAIPDGLLVPLLETAADTLRTMEPADVPPRLRQLQGFDRRGFLHGPAPRRLRRALAEDEPFATAVREAWRARPGVTEALERWSATDAVAIVEESARGNDLPLLASVLAVCEPDGAAFGLGLTVAADLAARRARGDAEAARERDRALAEAGEARRRADAARAHAEADAERAGRELRELRNARREREERAEEVAAAARREADALASRLAVLEAELGTGQAALARAEERVRAVEADLRRARADLARALEHADDAPTRLRARDARALADAVGTAERLAAALDAVRRRVEIAPVESRPGDGADRPGGGDRAGRAGRAPVQRARPDIPPGVVAASVPGVESMLRTDGALLVVDGYNVTKRAWGDATAADQRERLTAALVALRRRHGCAVVCVFDGDGSGPFPVARRDGVDVVFSDAGEEADEVVVRVVATRPRRVPVVVASSDGWVREHAAEEGAVVVPADALLAVLARR